MDFQQSLITTVHDYSLGNLDAIAVTTDWASVQRRY